MSSIAVAQPCPPGCATLAVPIDGGLGFLIAAGAAYGIRKVYAAKKSRKSIKE